MASDEIYKALVCGELSAEIFARKRRLRHLPGDRSGLNGLETLLARHKVNARQKGQFGNGHAMHYRATVRY